MAAESRDELFRTRIEPHRRAITLHCYRMLGSLQDGEEIAQESLVRGWQRLGEVKSSSSTRAWLYRIATNACLDLLKSRRRRSLPHLLASPPDPPTPLGPATHGEFWIEPAPDALLEVADDAEQGPEARASLRESISLAFVTALQFLSPKQRAVLLLVEVLGWKPQEVAELLETSIVSVNSLLQRARTNIGERTAPGASPAAPAGPDDAALLRRYIATWESGDLDAFTALLAEDAVLSMPPQPEWFAGRDSIMRFLESILLAEPRQYRMLPIRANGGPAVAVYSRPPGGQAFQPSAITLLSFRRGTVSRMTRFALPSLFPLFGLPDRLPLPSGIGAVNHPGQP